MISILKYIEAENSTQLKSSSGKFYHIWMAWEKDLIPGYSECDGNGNIFL